MRQHASAYVSIRWGSVSTARILAAYKVDEHTSAYVSIRQHTSAYVSSASTAVVLSASMQRSIRQHTSA